MLFWRIVMGVENQRLRDQVYDQNKQIQSLKNKGKDELIEDLERNLQAVTEERDSLLQYKRDDLKYRRDWYRRF